MCLHKALSFPFQMSSTKYNTLKLSPDWLTHYNDVLLGKKTSSTPSVSWKTGKHSLESPTNVSILYALTNRGASSEMALADLCTLTHVDNTTILGYLRELTKMGLLTLV